MPRVLQPMVGLVLAVLIGLATARTVDRALARHVEPWSRPAIGAVASSPAPVLGASASGATATSSLPLRLVDLGGVGIPTDTTSWGRDYSHNTHAFHRLILDSMPWVDAAEFTRVRDDWLAYVQRVARYGSTGIVVPLFLELITFDSLPAVYAGTRFTDRHRVVRRHLRELFREANAAGLDVYLATDIAPLTPPLARYLGGKLNAEDPRLWSAYRAAFTEAFATMPEVRGVVVRIGEAGRLYSSRDWDYRSEFLIGSAPALRRMLDELLPVFAASDRTLILRSWTVGVGELGALHTDPALYERVLGPIDSPNLVISTKVQAGDFYRLMGLNPTLFGGRHRRLVELQARREFEGFAAFPNWLGDLYGDALTRIRASNPHVVGTWVWTQNGGPLRAGPMSLYPRHGFWTWIDANVYVSAQLSQRPNAAPRALAAEWVRQELTTDSVAGAAMVRLLVSSSEAVERGFYVRPFARQRVTVGGYELPPLLWIMEWDVVAGWSTVWSNIYAVAGDSLATAVADGFAAVDVVDRMRADLTIARPALVASRPELVPGLERSLEYERSLLVTLAWYRAAFFNYYRWLDTGDSAAHAAWRVALPEFRRYAAAHRAAFAADLDFPAFDFDAGLRSADLARSAESARWIARILLGLTLLGVGVGAARARAPRRGPDERLGYRVAHAVWLAASTPWRLGTERLPRSALLAAMAAVFITLTTAIGLALSFTSSFASAALPVMLGTFLFAFKTGLTGWRWERRRDAAIAAAVAPVLWLAVALLALMSVRGPHFLWWLIWSGGAARTILVTAVVGVLAWTLMTLALAGRRVTRSSVRAIVGSLVLAGGAVLALVLVLSPGIAVLLAMLDRPLMLAPMTPAVVIGATTYTDLPALASRLPAAAAALIVVGGVLAWTGRGRVRGRAASVTTGAMPGPFKR